MPNLSEILQNESTNTGAIFFYREDVFYKAYERSAYLFVKYVRPFQVKKRMVKSVKQEVVSIGFPTNSLINYFSSDKIKEKENIAEVDLEKIIDMDELRAWKNKRTAIRRETTVGTTRKIYRVFWQILFVGTSVKSGENNLIKES